MLGCILQPVVRASTKRSAVPVCRHGTGSTASRQADCGTLLHTLAATVRLGKRRHHCSFPVKCETSVLHGEVYWALIWWGLQFGGPNLIFKWYLFELYRVKQTFWNCFWSVAQKSYVILCLWPKQYQNSSVFWVITLRNNPEKFR